MTGAWAMNLNDFCQYSRRRPVDSGTLRRYELYSLEIAVIRSLMKDDVIETPITTADAASSSSSDWRRSRNL